VRAGYSEAVSEGSLDIPLDVDSLRAYVEGNKNARALLEASDKVGIAIAPHHPNTKLPEYSYLLVFLDLAGAAHTLQDFDNDIASISTKATGILSQIIDHWSAGVSTPGLRLVVTKESLFRMAYFLALPPERASLVRPGLRFGSTLRDALEKVYRKLHDAPDFSIIDAQQGAEGDPVNRAR
jgi:hypothetical protein